MSEIKDLQMINDAGQTLGFECEDSQDLKIARTKLMQQMSPELQDEVLPLKVGDIINSQTKDKLPEEFIPFFLFKSYIRFNPRSTEDPDFDKGYEPNQLIWATNDIIKPTPEQLKDCAWRGQTPPLASTIYNFVS